MSVATNTGRPCRFASKRNSARGVEFCHDRDRQSKACDRRSAIDAAVILASVLAPKSARIDADLVIEVRRANVGYALSEMLIAAGKWIESINVAEASWPNDELVGRASSVSCCEPIWLWVWTDMNDCLARASVTARMLHTCHGF